MANRFQFIYNACVEFFGVTTLANQGDVIKEFLENDDVTVLAAVALDGEVLLQNAVPLEDVYGLLFYKIPNLDFAGHTGPAKIGLLTLEGGLAKSIYNSLQRVFSPYILRKCEYPPEIRTLLQHLHSSLGLSLGLTESGILSLADEVGFWVHKTKTLPTKADREAARSFAAILERISRQFGDGESMSLNQLDELIGVCQAALEEIWHLPSHFPQNRICSIFDMISVRVVTACTDHLMELDVWDNGTVSLDDAMGHVRETLDAWIETFDSLTRLDWPYYEPHPWIGDPYQSKLLSKFQTRYKEILSIRHLKDLLYALFFESEKYFPLVNEVAQPFQGMNVYDLTPLGNKRWETAKAKMELALAKIDASAAFVLQQKLVETGGNTRHAVMVFNRYLELLGRPLILETLAPERSQLFRSVDAMLRDLRDLLSGTNFAESDVTPDVAELRCYRVVQGELTQLESIVGALCRDRDGQANALKRIVEFREEMDALVRGSFEAWTAKALSAIRAGELSLREDQPVVEFDKSDKQLMKVTFRSRLVTFIEEARQLQCLGLKHPKPILDVVAHAVRFVAQARRLQQVATFHNTIGGVMVPCIRPIMLQHAMEFSRLVRSESVSWAEEESVERYIEALQEAVKRLLRDSNVLTGYHEQARKALLKLLDTDLIRQAPVWKEEMRALREVLAAMERQGYGNLQPFRLHWDHQLYKALEYQYVAGLLDVHHRLPEIHVELLFRQQRLQFRPTAEEIRSKYYAQVRRFIERPVNFKGLSEQTALFRTMIERNRCHFAVLYEKAEVVFRQLREFRDSWLPFVALGMVDDLEQLCTVHCTAWQHWDGNFRACKRFSQQLARIQEREKQIDCLVVNYGPLCSDIESLSRRYWEALAGSLRTSILDAMAELQQYLAYAFGVLQNIPQDELGIAESSAKYERIVADLPRMGELVRSLQGKDSCLAGWCKERVAALGGTLLQWAQLQPLIDNHQALLQGRLDVVKENVLRQLAELNEDAERFAIRWESTIKDLETNESADMTLFRERQTQWKQIVGKRETLAKQTEKFNITVPVESGDIFRRLELEIAEQGSAWQLFDDFLRDYETVASEEWTIYRRRPHLLTDLLSRWEQPKPATVATTRIAVLVDRYRGALPVLGTLQSEALIEKHWAALCQLLGIESRSLHELCLGDVLGAGGRLLERSGEIQTIVRGAASEHIIRQAIGELEQWAATATLRLTEYVDSGGARVQLIRDYGETLNKIGDHQLLLQSARNAASDSFADQADVWEAKLATLDYIVAHLHQIQKRWVYLEPIFGAGTLRREEGAFRGVDRHFRALLQEIAADPRVASLHRIPNVRPVIETLQAQIGRCQAALGTYIRAKRDAFARFYFLSDDDLLELLGQSAKESIVQRHIRKLLPGVARVVLTTDGHLTGIASEEGDQLTLCEPIAIAAPVPVEQWLTTLVERVRDTLATLIGQCLATGDTFDLPTVERYPMQVLCLVAAIGFTRRAEKAIVGMQLGGLREHLEREIGRHAASAAAQTTSDGLTALKLRALLIDLVHQRTTVDYLAAHHVTHPADWHWLQQLRFYAPSTAEGASAVTARMVYAEFRYGYEFLGNYGKLVYTLLAHRCYLTLTQAMRAGLGGNPFGPAGTGKTECVKSLGALLGRLVLVFNCDESMDTGAMALILTGLARCGAWGCFDEFNRLQEATLSGVSMLIQPLQRALADRQPEVVLNGETIRPLDPHCCVFVTLNPAGEEYGGRQQLPLNLQALFRPIAMQAPRPEQIARVTLFVEGFREADRLGAQLVELFRLAECTLSRQRHYDWGLRALKAVLGACGAALRTHEGKPEEASAVVRVIRTNLASRLTATDVTRFDVLLGRVFPGVAMTGAALDTELRGAVGGAFATIGLLPNERQIGKALELEGQLRKRMGVVVLGPPQCGKSTVVALLKEALVAGGRTVRIHTLSPKSMDRAQLLGRLDPDTRQWCDGVLTSLAVAVTAEPRTVTSWIVCDGDVDPEWIEALNSVLDDNRLLTLPSGWRIQFGANVNFLFETHDLSAASPATISRMGIVSLHEDDLPPRLLVDRWLATVRHPAAEGAERSLGQYCERFLDPALGWIEEHRERPAGYSPVSLAQSALVALDASARNPEQFCAGLLCGLNGALADGAKSALSAEVYRWADTPMADGTGVAPEYHHYNGFRELLEPYGADDITGATIDERDGYVPALVRTPLIKLAGDLLRRVLGTPHERPVAALLVGPSGNGKSLLLQAIVGEFAGHQLVTVSCSAQLTAASVLCALRRHSLLVTTVKGKEYRPPAARTVLYLRNLDLCAVDGWGTCEVVELLLQLIHRNGFYCDGVEWIGVSGVQVCASVASLDGPAGALSPRFLSACRLVRFGYPTDQDMESIVRSALLPVYNRLAGTAAAHRPQLADLVRSIIRVYRRVNDQFLPTVAPHYRFTPKMIERWIAGLLHYPDADALGRALVYEAERIFRDRLVSADDRRQLDGIMREEFGLSAPPGDVFAPANDASQSRRPRPGDLRLISTDEWHQLVDHSVTVCNAESVIVDVPMGDAFYDTVAAISRALVRPSVNLVLAGRTGSGRLQALHTACTQLGVKMAVPQLGRQYGPTEFSADLKLAMQTCALEGEPVAFCLPHAVASYLPAAVRACEAILAGGELAEDFFGDELENVAAPLKAQAAADSFQPSVAAFFAQRLKANFHLVLVLESGCPTIRALFERYPALYHKTEMIWMLPESVSTADDLRVYLGTVSAASCSAMQQDAESMGAIPLPGSFGELVDLPLSEWSWCPLRRAQLLRTYGALYGLEKRRQGQHRAKIQIGVDKLSETHRVVEQLKREAQEKQAALTEKRQLANQSLDMIGSTMRSANDKKTELLELQRQTQESSEKLIERKRAIEQELSLVEPTLREASAAVGQIKTEALSEIRSLRAPPEIVRDILEGVLRLMGIRDTSWNSMKTFLAKRGVKEDIRSLDPSRIGPENCAAVERLLTAKADSYEQRNAKRASAAAAPLAAWVVANVRYAKVTQSIKPLEREQNALKENLDQAEASMKSLSSGLDNVNDTVRGLSEQLNVYTQEAAMLEIKLDDAKNTLHTAEILVQSLSTEYASWNNELSELNQAIEDLAGRSFYTALNLTHLSQMSLEERRTCMAKLAQLTGGPVFDVDQQLVSNQDKIIWESMGLTADQQYRENAGLLAKYLSLPFCTTPVPLLVDPSEYGQRWLVNYLAYLHRTFELTSQGAERFAYSLELAVRFGKVLIVKGVNSIEPPLLSLFCTAVHSRFSKRLLQVGNKTVDLHDDFKLILVTQNETLPLGVELRAQLMALSFTTTVAGLTDVLTSRWVNARQPEIERKRTELLQEEGKLMKEKLNLQDKLLQELSSAQGDLLKNGPLLGTLNSIKASAVAIEKSLEEFLHVRDTIMEHYTQRTALSRQAAQLYMGIHRFYPINVTKYVTIFLSVVDNDKHAGAEELYRILVRRVHSLLSRSIPRDDQIILGLNVCKQAFPELLPEREWESFVHNFTNADTPSIAGGDRWPAWLRPELRGKVAALQTLHPDLYHQLALDNESAWRRYTESEDAVAPVSLSEFQQILIAQILRPDLLIKTIHRSVRNMLGLKTLYSTRPSIRALAEESSPCEPLLLVTASGMDPSEEIREHARHTPGIGLAKYGEFSIGKGQEMEALKLVKDAANTGSWICIKNVHTVPHFLVGTLDDTLKATTLADGFRLWLTTETDRDIGEVFLQKCLKVLYEPPAGLKHKLKLLLEQHSPVLDGKKRDFKMIKLHVGLFLLHSIVQERRSYIPQGWSKRYDFSDADLRSAMDMVQYVESAGSAVGQKIPWPLMRGLCGMLSYGGRIDNEQDFERLDHLIPEFIDERIMTSRWQPMFLNVTVPNSSHVQDYVKAFDQLPDTDSPTLYGIPSSTNASRDLIFCRNTLKALRSQYFSAGTVQNYEKRLRPIVGLWAKLVTNPTTIVTRLESLIERSRASTDPWTIFVVSELTTARHLHIVIGETLQALKLALKDAALLNAKDRTLLTAICDNLVPVQWRRIWSGPKTVIEYLRAVTFKRNHVESMFNTLLERQTLARVDFSHLFNVEAMLAVLKLCKAQELGVSTTDLTLCASFGPTTSNPQNGILVEPLLIDGGTLKHTKLAIQQSSASDASGTSTGPFALTYECQELGKASRNDAMAVPLYNSISRDALLCSITMDIEPAANKSQIISAGLALIVPETFQ